MSLIRVYVKYTFQIEQGAFHLLPGNDIASRDRYIVPMAKLLTTTVTTTTSDFRGRTVAI